jgi:hypothetical protein
MPVETLWKRLGIKHLRESLQENGALIVRPEGRSHEELFGTPPPGTRIKMTMPDGKVFTAITPQKDG